MWVRWRGRGEAFVDASVAQQEAGTAWRPPRDPRPGRSTSSTGVPRAPRVPRPTRPPRPPRPARQAPAPSTTPGIPVFDRNKVSLDVPGSLLGPSVSLLIKTTKIIGDVIQNSAVRYQTFLRLFRPLFRGPFEIKGLDPPTTTTTTTTTTTAAPATASPAPSTASPAPSTASPAPSTASPPPSVSDNELRRRRRA